jgi:hypothetical protein
LDARCEIHLCFRLLHEFRYSTPLFLWRVLKAGETLWNFTACNSRRKLFRCLVVFFEFLGNPHFH